MKDTTKKKLRDLVIFNGGDPADYGNIVKRITSKWKENAIFEKYEVTTEIESVG